MAEAVENTNMEMNGVLETLDEIGNDPSGSINSENSSSSEEEDDISTEDESGWIEWFTSLRGNSFFCQVSEDYIRDDFNLTGLSSIVPYYDFAMDIILDIENPNEAELSEIQQEMIESAAEMLYGLIHARFIITTRGMQTMLIKYEEAEFGRCHRVYCQGQPVLPVGQSDIPRHTTVNVYCPKCRQIYFPSSQRHGNLDGAYFGTTFAHLFLMTHPSHVPSTKAASIQYTPRVFGFGIHATSPFYLGTKSSKKKKEASTESL